MADIYDLLTGDDDATASHAQALANAIRGRSRLGQLGMLTGDKVLSPLGSEMVQQERADQQQLNQVPMLRQSLALSKAKLGQEQAQTQKLQAAQAAMQNPQTGRVLRQALASYGVGDLPEDTPATVLEGMLPTAEKGFAARESHDARIEAAREQAMLRRALFEAKGGADQEAQKFADAIDPSKGRAGEFGKQYARVTAAQRARALATDPLTGGAADLNPQQMAEFAQSVSSMISNGGQPTEALVREFLPKSGAKSMAELEQWLTSEPHGAGQQAFVKQMLGTVDREEALAKNSIKKTQVQRAFTGFGNYIKSNPDRAAAAFQRFGVDPSEIDFGKGMLREPAAQTPGAAPTKGVGGRVRVRTPDGTVGSIDASELQDALAAGWRKAD